MQTIIKLSITFHVFKTFIYLKYQASRNSECSGRLGDSLGPGGRPTTDPESSGRLEGSLG